MTATLRQRPAWRALEAHRAEIGRLHLRQLFAADPAVVQLADECIADTEPELAGDSWTNALIRRYCAMKARE